ncbi:MAG: CPBP family intramembrane metalloprotease [Clostridia bacterium]|nr:CPBP family intramembrane metalloprotease [Clostridia bacterium]
MTRQIQLKSLNLFAVCSSMMLFIFAWFGVVLIPQGTPYDATFKRMALTILLILLTKHFDKDLKIKLSEMYRNFDVKNFIYSLIGVPVYLFSVECLKYQKIVSLDFSDENFQRYISLFFLALFEEMLTRGWGYTAFWSVFDKQEKNFKAFKLFNKFSITKSELKAVLLTNLFFAIFHLQTFIMIYKYDFLYTLAACIDVFIIGVFFTLIFKKTKSMWNVIAVHFIWDYILGLIVH